MNVVAGMATIYARIYKIEFMLMIILSHKMSDSQQSQITNGLYLKLFADNKTSYDHSYGIELVIREGADVNALVDQVKNQFPEYEFSVFGPSYDNEDLTIKIDNAAHESMVAFTQKMRDGVIPLPSGKIEDPRSIYAMLSCSGKTQYVMCPVDVYMAITGAFTECYQGIDDIHFTVNDMPADIGIENDYKTKIFINRLNRLHVRICTDEEMKVATNFKAVSVLTGMLQSIDESEIEFLNVLMKYFEKYSTKKVVIEYNRN